MQTQPSYRGQTPTLVVDSKDDAACAITVSANAQHRWVIDKVEASYEAAPAAGDRLLTIALTQFGAAVTWTSAIDPAAGVEHRICLDFPDEMLIADANTAVTIGLTRSGTATVLGYLNVIYH